MNEELKNVICSGAILLAAVVFLVGVLYVAVVTTPLPEPYIPCDCPREVIETQHGKFHHKKTIIYHTLDCHNA